jgi:hypothetical protein
MRTKRVKVKTIAIMQEKMGQDLTRVWDIMSLMFATNIGMGLFLERKKRNLTLVHNNTEVPFITGDQPVINLHATGQVAPETLSFYYPISPTMALFLGEVEEKPAFSTDSLTSAQASVLNAKMLEACHSQLFGQSCASLLPLRELNRNTSP